jgi:hypothetical protein
LSAQANHSLRVLIRNSQDYSLKTAQDLMICLQGLGTSAVIGVNRATRKE